MARTKHCVVLFVCFFCVQPQLRAGEADVLQLALNSKHPAILRVMENIDQHELQVLFSRVKNGADESFVTDFNVDAKNYFYPASTIKLPMALLAAEYIDQHPELSLSTQYRLSGELNTYSVGRDIELIFTISDDDAFNRLYALIGRDRANQRLSELGYLNTRIAHRLGVKNAARAERQSLKFHLANGEKISVLGGLDSTVEPLVLNELKKGQGYLRNQALVSEPLDFSTKNYFSLADQQAMLSDFLIAGTGFALRATSKAFVVEQMEKFPREAGFDERKYFDGFSKFFIYGDSRERAATYVRIFNKVGYAYGTLTDSAYIVDAENGIEFLLAATILVNSNKIFNDDVYQYDEIGLPFLAQLGREIYQLELQGLSEKQPISGQ